MDKILALRLKALGKASNRDFNEALRIINECLSSYEQGLSAFTLPPDPRWWQERDEYYLKATNSDKIKYPKSYDEVVALRTELAKRPR